MKTINQLVQEAYATAKNNGFHEEPIEFGSLIALIHTEVTEVLTAKTPEDVTEELADILIRIYDMCGDKDIPLGLATKESYFVEIASDFPKAARRFKTNRATSVAGDIPLICLHLHTYLSDVMEMYRLKLPTNEKNALLATKIGGICLAVYEAGETLGLDITQAVQVKMEKNKQRPYKHNKII